MNKTLKGIGASAGVALAKVFLLKEVKFETSKKTISDIKSELKIVENAIVKAMKQLDVVEASALEKMGPEKAEIFQAHKQIANDPAIIGEINEVIENEKVNAAYAVETKFDKYAEIFRNMDNEYFKERAADVIDVKNRILSIVCNVKLPDILSINSEVVIVAYDLTPSETALLDKKFVKGFVTEIGGRTSHAAIMARSMEIPAVLGIKDLMDTVVDGTIVALNGRTGDVELNPTDEKKWLKAKEIYAQEVLDLKKYVNVKTQTLDGHKVLLEANIGSNKDAQRTLEYGSEGIGLFRSEFLYMDNSNWPTEDEQFHSYKEVLETLKGQLVIIRTLDIGGDKILSYHKFDEELNPFLGFRAIRFCLKNEAIFKTQLRALGRASAFGDLAIMFPMIATIDEFKRAKQLALESFEELRKEGHKVSDKILIGMMIEIPAAAMIADQFSKHSDFFSIGTNDLIQYSIAGDRMNKDVAYLYQPNNPSILRLVKATIDGGNKNKKWTGMCGEMAGNVLSVPLLLGLGLEAFSMSATSVPRARKIINNLNYKDCVVLAEKALTMETEAEINELVTKFLKDKNLI